MKKYLSSLLAIITILVPLNALRAEEGAVSFFEALGNFSKMEDYKLTQSFYGSIEMEEGEDHMTGDYRITVNSSVNGGGSEDSFNRVNALVKITNHNPATDSSPFKEMTIQANGEFIVLNEEDIYFKLNQLGIGLKDPLPFAVTDVEELKPMIDAYKGVWFHSGIETLTTTQLEETGATLDIDAYKELEEKMGTEPKEAILELSEQILKDTGIGLSEEEMTQAQEGIKLIMDAKLFNSRPIVSGQNNGFNFFTLNKTAIIGILEDFGQIIGEELTPEDEATVRGALSKFSFSGLYRMDEVNRVLNNLMIKLRVKETGPVKNLELSYRYKVSDINKKNRVSAPTDYTELSDLTGENTEAESF